jgi:hypothetical protein
MDAQNRSTPIADQTAEQVIGLGLLAATDAMKAAHHSLCRAMYVLQTNTEIGFIVDNETTNRTEEEVEEVLTELESVIDTWPALIQRWLAQPARLEL